MLNFKLNQSWSRMKEAGGENPTEQMPERIYIRDA